MVTQRWVSSKEAAREIGVSHRMAQSLLARGLIAGARRVGDGPRARWAVPSPVVRIRAPRGPRNRPGFSVQPE